jgi:hypothetical protein
LARLGIGFEDREITADAELERRYRDDIPVIMVDGRPISRYRVDAAALRAALGGELPGPASARLRE